ncbi:MAG: sigma 54-interacting transcriptional regulator [Candidatus Anammoxibacter sp.]
MIDWSSIQKTHVLNAFRQVSYKWWDVDIHLFDEFGNCHDSDTYTRNRLCKFLHSSEKGKTTCKKNYLKHLKYLSKTKQAFCYKCFSGLQGVAVPIIVNGDYIGALAGCGILSVKDAALNKKRYVKKLGELGFDNEKTEISYKALKNVNGHSMEYLKDFMEMVATDVISLIAALLEKDNIIKMQTVLLEKAYSNKYKGIISVSTEMKEVFDTLDLVENSESPVLIEGESGTGKELVAAAVHYNSPRRDQMFVIQNCSAFSDTLLSSELFGHEKGSFTGAIADKKGLFEIADGGTLFLDEIGDMDIDVQSKLLRVLEGGTFYAVGGTVQKNVNVRIIAATNKELKKQIEKGLFREDLFFRINTMHITVPPLRKRKDDVLLLANHFVETHAEIHNSDKKELSQEVIEQLSGYDWPGNVRELKNLIERLIIISGSEKVITLAHLPKEMRSSHPDDSGVTAYGKCSGLRGSLASFEMELVKTELDNAGWNKTAAANELNISRASLNNKINQYGLRQGSVVT